MRSVQVCVSKLRRLRNSGSALSQFLLHVAAELLLLVLKSLADCGLDDSIVIQIRNAEVVVGDVEDRPKWSHSIEFRAND